MPDAPNGLSPANRALVRRVLGCPSPLWGENDINALLEAARADASQGVGEGWRSIETAPKDGREVDLWLSQSGRTTFCRWLETGEEDEPFAWMIGDGVEWVEGEDDRATHWMPLPAAPDHPSRGEG